MSHDHDHHSHSHSHGLDFQESNRRAFIVGIYLNMAFVIAEIIGGLIFNSMSLLTDAGHNLSDVASLFLSLLAFKMAAKKSIFRPIIIPRLTPGFFDSEALVRREAVEQARAAGGDQVRLAAGLGHMRGIPGREIAIGIGAFAVMMAQHGRAFAIACPVLAR